MQTVFTKSEWREIARMAVPDMTEEQYDEKWERFQDLKEKGLLGGDIL